MSLSTKDLMLGAALLVGGVVLLRRTGAPAAAPVNYTVQQIQQPGWQQQAGTVAAKYFSSEDGQDAITSLGGVIMDYFA